MTVNRSSRCTLNRLFAALPSVLAAYLQVLSRESDGEVSVRLLQDRVLCSLKQKGK